MLIPPTVTFSPEAEDIESRAKKAASEALFQASDLLNEVTKEAEVRFTGEVKELARHTLKSVYQQVKSSVFLNVEKACRDLGLEVPPTRLGSSDFNVEFPEEVTEKAMEDTSEFIEKLLTEHYQPYGSQETDAESRLQYAEEALTQLCEDGTAALAAGFILQLQDSLSAYISRLLATSSHQLERSLEALINARIDEILTLNPAKPLPDRSEVVVPPVFRSPQASSTHDKAERMVKTTSKTVPPRPGSVSNVPKTTVSSTLKQFLSSEIKFDF